MRFRRILAASLASATLAVAPAATAHQPTDGAIAVSAKTCSAGFTHAVINGAEKCLKRGQFCAHDADRQYRRYGFRCTKYDSRADRYRLT